MSTTPDDELYRIFEERLYSGDYDDQPTEVLLTDVVDRYWAALDMTRTVPMQLQRNVRNDLTDDVRDMLRRKIYGHLGVGEFNRARGPRGK